ncbi:MAG: GTP pyrophosphokinase family protein, partial [Clostridia bacterium]|nr:GTP pyrophosphokinase family protein [Clostridia bacterium]
MNERDLKKAQMENWMSEHGNIDEMRDKLEWMTERSQPFRELMAYYKCAMMEVETKFNVLNQEFSVQYDRNPIESIRSRIKEPPSILDKLLRNNLPMT